MNKIYKIEFNDCIYYGSTKQKYLSSRQSRHNHNLKHNPKQLLYSKANEQGIKNLVCELICTCNDSDRFKIENDLINSCEKECLNDRKANYTEEERKEKKKENNKRYNQTDKGKYKKAIRDKRYYQKNKDTILIKNKEYYQKRKNNLIKG